METTKYESVFKNPEGFTQQEITQLRTKVIAFSRALVGRRLAIPVSDNLDLNYKKKMAGDMPGLILANPMKKYMIETVDLFNVDIVRTANGKIVIMFNNDEKLQFDLRADVDIVLKAGPKDVQDAILKFEATGERSPFWNVKMVTEVVTQLNQSNLTDLNNFIDELANQGASLEQINKTTKDDTTAYYKSIDE